MKHANALHRFYTVTDLLTCCRLGWFAQNRMSTSSSRWRKALRSWRTRAGSTWFTAGQLCCRLPWTSLWITSYKVGGTATMVPAVLAYLWTCVQINLNVSFPEKWISFTSVKVQSPDFIVVIFLEIIKMTNTQKRNIKNVGNRSLGHLLTFQHLFVVISESS